VWFKRQSNYFANKTMSLSPRPTKTTNKQKTKTKQRIKRQLTLMWIETERF
jgi:hypothetical protein